MKYLHAIAGVLIVGSFFGGAAAQETPDPLDVTPVPINPIDLGPLGELEMLADEPVQVCVIGREEDASGARVRVVEAYLTPDGPFGDAPKWLQAVGPLADARLYECRGLADDPLE